LSGINRRITVLNGRK